MNLLSQDNCVLSVVPLLFYILWQFFWWLAYGNKRWQEFYIFAYQSVSAPMTLASSVWLVVQQ